MPLEAKLLETTYLALFPLSPEIPLALNLGDTVVENDANPPQIRARKGVGSDWGMNGEAKSQSPGATRRPDDPIISAVAWLVWM